MGESLRKTGTGPEKAIKAIETEVRSCAKCPLSATRKNAVPGEGDLRAGIIFIGEAPGRAEDASGRPFVGAAGRFLNELLESAGLRREDVFITNIVKCKPPKNRMPEPGEVS